MKILYVIPQVWTGNGAAKLLVDLLPYQSKEYAQVDVLAWKKLSPSFEDTIKNLGCGIRILGLGHYNPLILFHLIKAIRDYDIVHVHLFPALYWVAIAKLFVSSRIKFVLTEHSTKNNRQGKVWLRPIEKLVYRSYDRIIAISKGVERIVRELDSSLKVETIYNGVDLQKIENAVPIRRSELDLPEDSVVLIQVARFNFQKDQKTVLRSLQHLPANYYCVFVGSGRLLQEHIDYAKELGVIDRTRFLGMRDDVPSLLKAADIFVMSSHFEGFGLAAVEGMAAGKPVIASNVEGLNEVVEGAGLLFTPCDEKELVASILRLSQDSEYYKKVADACKERSRLFDIKRIADSYMSVYRQLLNTISRIQSNC